MLICITSYLTVLFLVEDELLKMFGNLKTRYSRIRNQLKKAKSSGAGRAADVQKQENHLNKSTFLFWLYPFIILRKSQSN